MTLQVKAPQFPESVAEGTLVAIHVAEGDAVAQGALIAEVETDKVILEVMAESDGTISALHKAEGDTVLSGEVIADLTEGSAPAALASTTPNEAPAAAPSAEFIASPAAKRIAEENAIDLSVVSGTGKDGRITKEDVVNILENGAPVAKPAAEATSAPAAAPSASSSEPETQVQPAAVGNRVERRVPMTRIRARIAERLLQAKNETAMLTTFNEVNMAPVMALRSKYKEAFLNTHDVKLGFMSFFVKAATEALKRYPSVNASIDGNDIVYHEFQDIGVAVSSDRGLVVPILRNTEFMSLAEVEKQIVAYGKKAQAGKISMDDMAGGTFTISNGGIFGSLLSTPIINPPQTAILGMHSIQERPMAVDGEVKILPMMYLALSYDHRLIDGREAVQFLVSIKNQLEDPARMLLDI